MGSHQVLQGAARYAAFVVRGGFDVAQAEGRKFYPRLAGQRNGARSVGEQIEAGSGNGGGPPDHVEAVGGYIADGRLGELDLCAKRNCGGTTENKHNRCSNGAKAPAPAVHLLGVELAFMTWMALITSNDRPGRFSTRNRSLVGIAFEKNYTIGGRARRPRRAV